MKKNTIIALSVIALLFVGGYTLSKNKPKQTQDQESQVEETDQEQAENKYIDVSPEKAKELIDNNPDLIIVDVSPNYDEGHLPGAVNYYVGDGSLENAIPTLNKNATYLVYCHVDSASIQGSQMLIDAGFSNVYRLEGNYAAWVDAGYEIEK